MEKSESIINISVALNGFHKSVGKIKKESTNPFFGKKYADLSDILDTINDPLVSNGLSVIQLPKDSNELETILLHTSGEFISSTYKMIPVKSDPQSLGSAITYQRRYALSAILSLNIDSDDDGNQASGKNDKAQNEKSLKEKYDLEVSKACEKMMSSKTDEEAVKCWNLYPQFVKEQSFIKACSEIRSKIKNSQPQTN